MMQYKNLKRLVFQIKIWSVEVDPRSKTTSNGSFNYIPTGDNLKKLEVKKNVSRKEKRSF